MARFNLRPYQREAVDAVVGEWSNGVRSTLLVMATGTGKTVVFAEVIRRWKQSHPGRGVLVMAHRRVLVEQARKKLEGIDGVEVATVQAASRRAQRTPADAYGLIVIDEAHHSLARSYKAVIDRYAGADVLGVTATPERADGVDMGEVFDTVAYTYDMADGIRDGYLSQVRICAAPLAVDLGGVHTRQGDYDAKELAGAVEPLLKSAARWIKENASDRHVVVFLPLVETAKKMADACAEVGLASEEVDGESVGRDAALKRFEDGETQVLCNAALLTEGWDAPICDCVMVLRPTQSRALYVQMVGRGTRLHDGKSDLLVPDVLALNAKHDVMRPADVFLADHDEAVDLMEAADAEPATVEELKERRDVVAEREAALVAAAAQDELEDLGWLNRALSHDDGKPADEKRRQEGGRGFARRAARFVGRALLGTAKVAGKVAFGLAKYSVGLGAAIMVGFVRGFFGVRASR